MIDPDENVDELIRRARLPRREPAKSQVVRWRSMADTHQWKRRQPEMTGTVARAVGEIGR